MCSWKFFSSCQFHRCRLILKSKVIAYFCLFFSGIIKRKFLDFFCCHESVRGTDFFYIVFSIYRKVSGKSNLSFFVRSFLLNQGILLKQHIPFGIFNIFFCIKTEDSACKDTIHIFFFFQDRYFHFLTGILPFFVISDDQCILITIGQIHVSRFAVQNITMGSFDFFHIVFSCRKISKLCNTIGIRCNGSNLFIRFKVIFADTICSFDILCRKYIKRNILKASGYIFKQMLYGTFYIVKKGYFIQKLTVFVDDQKSGRHFIFHFNLLNLCGILNLKFHISCFQVSIRSNFFSKGIFFPYRQTLDHMWLIFYRSPFIYNVYLTQNPQTRLHRLPAHRHHHIHASAYKS